MQSLHIFTERRSMESSRNHGNCTSLTRGSSALAPHNHLYFFVGGILWVSFPYEFCGFCFFWPFSSFSYNHNLKNTFSFYFLVSIFCISMSFPLLLIFNITFLSSILFSNMIICLIFIFIFVSMFS